MHHEGGDCTNVKGPIACDWAKLVDHEECPLASCGVGVDFNELWKRLAFDMVAQSQENRKSMNIS